MRVAHAALIVLSTSLSVSSVLADQVTLTNGDRISGRILHKTEKLLLIRTHYAGNLRIRAAEIAAIATDKPVTILLYDGTEMNIRLGQQPVLPSLSPQSNGESSANQNEPSLAGQSPAQESTQDALAGAYPEAAMEATAYPNQDTVQAPAPDSATQSTQDAAQAPAQPVAQPSAQDVTGSPQVDTEATGDAAPIPEEPSVAAIHFINPTPDEAGTGFTRGGRAGLSLTQTRGNSTDDFYHGDVELVLRGKVRRYTLSGDGNYGRDGGVASTFNWRAGGRFDQFYRPKEFVYIRLALENDRYKDIRLRSQLGGGYGYQLYENDATTLNVRGGLAHITTSHYDDNRERYAAFTWGAELKHKLKSWTAEFFHIQDGTTALDGKHGTVLQTKTGFRMPLGEQLSATAQINADWESEPGPESKEADTTVMFGLGYVFR